MLLVIAPLCFVITPLLYLYCKNQVYYNLLNLLTSILVFVTSTLILFGSIYMFFGRFRGVSCGKERLELTSFSVTVLIVLFNNLYSLASEYLADLIGIGFPLAGMNVPFLIIGPNKILFPFFCGALIAIIFSLRKSRRLIPQYNQFLSAAGLILIFIAIVQIILTGHKPTFLFKEVKNTIHMDSKRPNIYYIILDTYARSDVLKKYDGFDNSDFLNYLQNKGFYIATKSRCNYPVTLLSLRASLNMGYFPVPGKGLADPNFLSICRKDVQQNNVAKNLIQNGYTYIPIGHFFFDENFAVNDHTLIAKGYYQTGALWLDQLAHSPFSFVRIMANIFQDNEGLRKNIMFDFDLLKKSIDYKGNKFVFAHFWGPHFPYVFHADGTPLKNDGWNSGNKKKQVSLNRQKYIGQLQFTNNHIKTIIDTIIKVDSTAIIVLQSDHGEWTVDTLPGNHDYMHDTSFIAQRMPNLSAYRVPPEIRSALYDSISPVNSFRVILNKLGYLNCSLLPDNHYVLWWNLKKGAVKIDD